MKGWLIEADQQNAMSKQDEKNNTPLPEELECEVREHKLSAAYRNFNNDLHEFGVKRLKSGKRPLKGKRHSLE
ncbi:hypothetical protein [Vibrio gallicus]|uniref:hypothetical protein n=1 Tax=Vibrio gallicus TaxID=190897 RepID=UPI0036F2902B